MATFVIQSLSHIQFFATPWAAAHQVSLFLTSHELCPLSKDAKLMSIESMMPPNHLLLPLTPAFNLSQRQGLFQ